jgi:two-component system sensor histidine kinase VanS
LHEQLSGKTDNEIIQAATEFYNNNQSFTFYIRDSEGNVVFSTPNIDTDDDFNADEHRVRMAVSSGYTLFAASRTIVQANHNDLIQRSLFALICMLTVGVFGAFIFARQMTAPIKKLANDTKKMSVLEDVDPLPERYDEIGNLARDVHFMYGKLKESISNLEDEILRVCEMEETQRYFFSAASHELKTPIAATSVLLEGMIENIGEYKDRPKYLRECVKLMDSQNKIITEMLELVNLNDGKILPNHEEINVRDTLMSVTANIQTIAEANNQRITIDVSRQYNCIADKGMIRKVLSNVILNAVQNTPADGEIKIWCEPIADQYRICVLNKGAVIEKEILSKLFDPFYRIDKARSRKDGRSGLGLTIVQKTLQAMGADFSLTQTNDGILFWADFPAA